MGKKMTPTKPKICRYCGKQFHRKPRWQLNRWESRRACSHACASALRRKLVPITCSSCGNEFQPKASRDKFCSTKCSARSQTLGHQQKPMHKKYRRVVMHDGRRVLEHRAVMERHLRRRLLATESVHHRNGNSHDNSIENLELWTCRTHPYGQRVDDLLDFVIANYRLELLDRIGVA